MKQKKKKRRRSRFSQSSQWAQSPEKLTFIGNIMKILISLTQVRNTEKIFKMFLGGMRCTHTHTPDTFESLAITRYWKSDIILYWDLDSNKHP